MKCPENNNSIIILLHQLIILCYVLLAVFKHAAALNPFQEIVHQSLLADEAAGNFAKGYDFLAQSIMRRLQPYFPSFRFVVLITSTGTDVSVKMDHIMLQMEPVSSIGVTLVVFIYMAFAQEEKAADKDNDKKASATPAACYGNVTAEFQDCLVENKKLMEKFLHVCDHEAQDVEASKVLDMLTVVKEPGLGVASTLAQDVFMDETYSCPSGRWRVVSVRHQNYEMAVKHMHLQSVEFPSVIDTSTITVESGVFRVPTLVVLFGSIGAIVFLLLFAAVFLFLIGLLRKSGGVGLELHAFWFLRIRSGLDHMLESSAVDNEYLLYSGPNSRVYFARYRSAPDTLREVAVKVPSREAFRMDMIIEETRINAQLRHERIVEYIGYFRDMFGDIRIVSEFMGGGNLHAFVSDRKNPLTVGHLFNYVGQICEGMEYLASRRIIHRDLAARNCMLTTDCTAIKIADFGLSRHFNLDTNYTCTSPVRLPVRWTAIECLGQNGDILPSSKFSEKSDIWSFGVVCWECFTRGEMPYGAEEFIDVLGALRSGQLRLPCPAVCPLIFYENFMLKCWDACPQLRPDFTMAKHTVEEIFGRLIVEMPEIMANELL